MLKFYIKNILNVFNLKMNKFKRLIEIRKRNFATTQECFAISLMIGRCFAMFPLDGILKSNFRLLRFRWHACSTIYTILYTVGILFLLCFHIDKACRSTKLNFGHFVTFLFYFFAFIATLLFCQLAQSWPQLMKEWTEIDFRMHSYGFPKRLSFQLTLISSVVLLGALKHGLSLTTSIINTAITNAEHSNSRILTYLEVHYEHIFRYFQFTTWKAVLLFIVNLMCTFTWNYVDVIIMLASIALTVRFRQITHCIKLAISNKVHNEYFWKGIRNDYIALAELCNRVDNAFSGIILLSFANNLFFILVQLLNSLKARDDSTIDKAYFFYSFAFLIFRAMLVCIYGASVYEAGKEPTSLLLSVSSNIYNTEIQRLLYKIHTDPCSLTGKRFFHLKKALILNIAGAIVTYELVLIQFRVSTND